MRKRLVMCLVVCLFAGLSSMAWAQWGQDDGTGPYVTVGYFMPEQSNYDDGWEIGAVALPSAYNPDGWRWGLFASFFDTTGYGTGETMVPPGDQIQVNIDGGYVYQLGGENGRNDSYIGAGITLVSGSWDGPQGNVDDTALGFHIVAGTRASENFLIEIEWTDAQYGDSFANEEAGGLVVRGGFEF